MVAPKISPLLYGILSGAIFQGKADGLLEGLRRVDTLEADLLIAHTQCHFIVNKGSKLSTKQPSIEYRCLPGT
jgi:hypothetical protein